MTLLLLSLIAGILTVLAPCILPLLPVVLGGSLAETHNRKKPLVIVGTLALSVFLFTFLIKASTVLIGVPESFWRLFSAVIIGLFGLTLLFPDIWARLAGKIPGMRATNALFMRGYQHAGSFWGDAAIGIAMGPIFASCSPTYFIILATVLPQSFARGTLYIGAYVLGLSLVLFAIAILGQKIVSRLDWAANPSGWFKRVLGIVFLFVAVFVGSGTDKKVQTAVLDAGIFDITRVERKINDFFKGN
jgi:cytochrome c-type biogenesis protein